MSTELRPDLQALVNMAIAKLNAIAETIPDTDKLVSVQVAKHNKQLRGLVDMIREDINQIREAHKAAVAKKGK